MRASKPTREMWNLNDCRMYLRYKKQKNDPVNPKVIDKLRERCRIVDGRTSPDISLHDSDDDEGVTIDDISISSNDYNNITTFNV
jgi:hypothetical protein